MPNKPTRPPHSDYSGPGFANIETGEVVDFVAQPRRRKQQGGPWIMVVQNAAERIARDDLPDGDLRVFFALLGRLDWENYLLLSVSELARDLGRSRESVSRALKRLVEHDYLVRGPRVGRASSYRLSPDVGWKGTDAGRTSLQRKIDQRGFRVYEGGTDDSEMMPGQTTIEDEMR